MHADRRETQQICWSVKLYSGCHTLPRQKQYREKSPNLVTLSKNDLEDIKQYIHLADKNNLAPCKFAKV